VVYEPGSFVPMLRIDDTEQGQVLSAYITDALGTPMQLVTPNGQPRWLAEPDDWAAVKNQRAVRNVTQPIRFQGQWHDEESGLYYNRHRYYDPQQGRYISQDPIGLNGGTNLYGYVTNPTGMVDPLGLRNRRGPYGLGSLNSQSNMIRRSTENISSRWSNLDSLSHYRNDGPDVTLREIGHLSTIQNSATTQGVLSRFGNQINETATAICASNGPGTFDINQKFHRSYSFYNDKFFIGSATLSGDFNGTIDIDSNGAYAYTGDAEINFYDEFTDPYDTFNFFERDWNPDGTPYDISDQWSKTYQGGGICR